MSDVRIFVYLTLLSNRNLCLFNRTCPMHHVTSLFYLSLGFGLDFEFALGSMLGLEFGLGLGLGLGLE